MAATTEGLAQGGTPEDSAIIGLACRVPGAMNPSQLWKNIADQKDVQRKMPEDRFRVDSFYHPDGTNKGTTNSRYGYFLEQDVADFDASFFGISGKEAEAMDPQQRLLLEVVYEALENAGITLQEISGSSTSVFCGSFTNDYNSMLTKDLESYPKYMVTGTGNAILSNRISYFFNLHGTSVTIDTACSSSLVCFHLGNQTLRSHESDLSIVVGSAIHFDPNIYVTMTDLGMLSTDGRCRAFDASGSGYVRGEGICAVVLKRRSDAERSGDNIRALVRNSLSNHDGKKNGITLPNTHAQEALIRATYKGANLDPKDTQYFEAHGTGTAAGDPLETRAIGAVFAPGREQPLYVGSVKTNIGHLEGASGLAGIIKTTMALEKGFIPPNMLFQKGNPKIDFENWKIRVPQAMTEWKPDGGVARRASVNSFGYGGTNVHIILEEYKKAAGAIEMMPRVEPIANGVHARPFLLPLSSHSPKAGELSEVTLKQYLERREGLQAGDLAHSFTKKSDLHQHRSFIVAENIQDVMEQITKHRPGAPWTHAKTANADKKLRLGFVFTGQGAQWFAMGRQLIQECPIFKQTLERCNSVLHALPDAPSWSIISELSRPKEDSLLSQTIYSQTICTALQLALMALIREWNIVPDAVIGHSSGEMGAAYAAGILSFDNAIIAAYYRGLYMSVSAEGSAPGAMLAAGLREAEAMEEIRPYKGKITVAAVNSPTMVTISGDEDAVVDLKGKLTERKLFARQLQVKQAFHSHHMIPLAPAYENALKSCESFKTEEATCRMFSSVTARVADHEGMGPKYWATNMTHPVRFSDAVTGILLDEEDEQNIDVLVEIGPHPALKGPCREIAKSLKLGDIPYVASLTRGVPDFECLLKMAGQLYSLGYPVDLAATNENLSLGLQGELIKTPTGRKLDDLPSYTWDHKRYWSETRLIKNHRLRQFRHSVLGHIIPGSVAKRPLWRNYIRMSEIPWLAEHVVDGKVIFPGAGYISMAVEAALRIEADAGMIGQFSLKDIVIKSALIVPSTEEGVEILLELKPATVSSKSHSDTMYEFNIFSYDDNGTCNEHCKGVIGAERGAPGPVQTTARREKLEVMRKKTNRSVPVSAFYRQLNSIGLEYGEKFRLLKGSLESGPGFSMSELVLDPTVLPQGPADATAIHPTLLDASFHVIFNAIESCLGRSLHEPYVPSFIRSLKLSGKFVKTADSVEEQKFLIGSFTTLPSARVAISDLVLQDSEGDLVMEIQGLEVTSLGRDAADGQVARALFFNQRWLPCFQFLSSDVGISRRSLADIVDIYAHQYANSKILHLSPALEKSKQLIRNVGAFKGQRRRIQGLDVVPAGADVVFAEDDVAALGEVTVGLARVCEPHVDRYDLIVIDQTSDFDFASHVKEGGCVIFDGKSVDCPSGFTPVFSTHDMSAFIKGDTAQVTDDNITAILPCTLSDRTKAILSHLNSTYPGELSTTTFQRIGESDGQIPSENVVVLSSFDENIEDAATFQGVKKLLVDASKKIIWLTEGGTMECSRPEMAMIPGMVRSARSENDQIRVTILDSGVGSTPEVVSQTFIRVLESETVEDELSERSGCVYTPKVEADDERNRKLPNGPGQEPHLEPFGERRALTLKIGKIGLLETLYFGEDEEIVDTELDAEDIEIEVKASAINFRDIAASMGIIDDYKLGDECAGIVTQVGSKVEGFAVGDHVVAGRPGQGAHKGLVRNPAILCYKLQGDMSFSDAAALPLILTTAYYSLIETARLQPGETVLIHAAAGGVGQMAIQLAQRAGANILATVGSQAKRDLLTKEYGIRDDQMFSSRDDFFVAGVLDATNGRGVDVALNSLAGPLLHATWACIAPFGRLIEIGKRDIHENTKIAMDPFRRNVMFASVDLITIFEQNKPLASRVFQTCSQMVHEGHIKLPATVLEVPYSEVVRGFRLLQMGKHTGKVVLVPHKDDLVPVIPARFRNTQLFDAEKTYLLVGGLGGLGQTLSQWMVRKGAKRLAFLSRSGAAKPEAIATLNWLEERGVQVTAYKGDVSKLGDVQACVDSIGDCLAGIFQAAMVLQDAPLDSMTFAQWQRCVDPKVLGVQNLHQATLGQKLDFFVCFSSVAPILGSKAQANYSAANSFLDAFMRRRREMGLAGTTMNVGAVSGAGVVSESVALQKVMERLGMDVISEEELLYQLEEAVRSDTSVTFTPEGVDAHRVITGVGLIRADVHWAIKPLTKNLYANHDFDSTKKDTGTKKISAALADETDMEKKTDILLDAFLEKIASVLATPRDSILPSNPLSAYGLDSIVAVEFRKWFRKEVNVDIALFDILVAQSIHALAAKGARMVTTTVQVAPKATDDTTTKKDDAVAATIEEVSSAVSNSEIPKATSTDIVPLSSYQSRLWFIHSFVEDKSFLNLPILMRLDGAPCLDSLQTTMYEFIRRNPALRTSYFEGENFAQQRPVDDFDIHVDYRNISDSADTEATLQELMNYDRQIPLNIEDGEVTAWTLIKLSEEKYAFLCRMHHISVDRGCVENLMNQIISLYDAVRADKDLATIPRPQLDYVDFTLWHNARLESDEMRPHLDWWRSNLAGSPEASQLLPFAEGPRPARNDPITADCRTTLDAKLFTRMKRISAQSAGTPFHFILAALRAFIFRYTQEKDLVLLAVDGNRPHPDAENIAGFFVNMCPIRCHSDCDNEDVTFDALFASTKDRALEAMAHSSVPFNTIVDIMHVKKTPSHMPIGQIAVNYQIHGPVPKYSTSDFVVGAMETNDIPTACDMSLEVLERGDHALDLRLEFSTGLYGEESMDRFLDNFRTFLSGVIKDYRQPIVEVAMCGEKEREFLFKNFENTAYIEPEWKNTTVVEKIRDMSGKEPAKTAIQTSDGESIAYGELMKSADAVASVLIEAGVEAQEHVAMLAYPGVDAVVGMLGAHLTRSCYVALDTDFATERLAFMISDAGSKVLLVGPGAEGQAETLGAHCAKPPMIIKIQDAINTIPTVSPASFQKRQGDDPFYMVYTSGSTGTPKGVVLSESNTHQMLSTLHATYSFSPADAFLHQSSMSFDLSIVQIFNALAAGATIATASWSARKDPSALASFMKETGVTVTYFTPTQFSLLMESNLPALQACADYRVAFFAGERLPPRLVRAFYAKLSHNPVVMYNTWSPSELVVQTTIAKIPVPEEGQDVSPPIGYPLDNCRHYILDSKRQLLPYGLVGELCVGGAQVGQGYLNRPDVNRSSFLEDPFCSTEDVARGWTRMFKTGDRGCFRPDGQLEFHGRIAGDKQIKFRGFRVDLGEVEQRIFMEAKEVKRGLVDIAVVARKLDIEEEGDDDGQRLVAYMVPKAGNLDEERRQGFVNAIHEKIREYLNDYMLPCGYQLLDRLPTTIGGKVERRSLLERKLELVYPGSVSRFSLLGSEAGGSETKGSMEDTGSTTPMGTEKGDDNATKMLGLFQAILSPTRYTSPYDNFFEKGGHSILLVRLQARILSTFKVAPSLPQLLKEPTAAAALAHVNDALSGVDGGGDGGEMISWASETKLPMDGRYMPRFGAATNTAATTDNQEGKKGGMEDVLLTGAESFAGIHILAQLLTSPENAETRVHVLGTSEVLTNEVLVSKMGKYDLFTETLTEAVLRNRITLIPGHLSTPSFSLRAPAFRRLGESLAHIFHVGTTVSLLQTYNTLKAANVTPILDLIRLAGMTKMGRGLTPIHYLSTWSVAHLQGWGGSMGLSRGKKSGVETVVTDEQEMNSFLPPAEDEFGYFKTRWVAERLLSEAAKRGFPVTITRASAITAAPFPSSSSSIATTTPSKTTSVVDPNEEFTLDFILTMMSSGLIPRIGGQGTNTPEFAVDVIPVKYMAAAFLLLSTTAPGTSTTVTENGGAKLSPRIFHLVNPSPLPLSQLPAVVRSLAPEKEVRETSLEEYLAAMDDSIDSPSPAASATPETSSTVEKLAGEAIRSTVLHAYLAAGHVMFPLDGKATRDVLEREKAGFVAKCPGVDEGFLGGVWRK